jgi:hypothetical protein
MLQRRSCSVGDDLLDADSQRLIEGDRLHEPAHPKPEQLLP